MNLPEGQALLAPGATDDAIQRLQSIIGVSLPTAWVALLKENNGQLEDDDPGLLGGWVFLSTEAIAREWKSWEAVRTKASPSLLYNASYTSEPPSAIEEVYTSAGWIPLAKEPMEGNYVGLDFDPGPAGHVGQVINFGRDEDQKSVLVPGSVYLLEWLADCYESGEIVISREDGGLTLTCSHERLSTALMQAAAHRKR
jgi:cell wall assembly regulator SMI1